jgi:hypothetical protein
MNDRDQLLSRRSFVGLGAALLAGGCTQWQHMRRDERAPAVVAAEAPPAANLIAYLNGNARRVQAMQCNKVAIDCLQGSQAVGLDGMLVCQKPRNFRLKAKVVGQPTVDVGSNDTEFWYWISKAPEPYVFHCNYVDFARGNVRVAFPFQPDMVVSALGIAEYDPNKDYKVRSTQRTWELVENTTSPSGQPVEKITVFDRVQASGNRPQVIGHVLKDANGQEICSASVFEVQHHRQTGAVLPFKVKLTYPAEKAEMTLRLYDAQVVSLDPQRAGLVFSRRELASLKSFDLARGIEDGQGQGLRQAGAVR